MLAKEIVRFSLILTQSYYVACGGKNYKSKFTTYTSNCLCQSNWKRKFDESNQVYNQPFAVEESDSTTNSLPDWADFD